MYHSLHRFITFSSLGWCKKANLDVRILSPVVQLKDMYTSFISLLVSFMHRGVRFEIYRQFSSGIVFAFEDNVEGGRKTCKQASSRDASRVETQARSRPAKKTSKPTSNKHMYWRKRVRLLSSRRSCEDPSKQRTKSQGCVLGDRLPADNSNSRSRQAGSRAAGATAAGDGEEESLLRAGELPVSSSLGRKGLLIVVHQEV